MLLIKITQKGDVVSYKKDNLNSIIKNKKIDKLHIWDYNDSQLTLYGSIDGKAGKENKYELSPPLDSSLFFNDLYIIKYKNNKVEDLTLEEYNKFYEDSYGGFEDIADSEEDEEDTLSEHTSDREFINDDSISDFSTNGDITSSIISTISNNIEKIEEKSSDEKNTCSQIDSDSDELISSMEITFSDVDEDNILTDDEN